MSAKNKTSLMHKIRHRDSARRKNGWITLLTALLIIAIILMGVYAAVWYFERSRILNDSRRYQNMYTPATPSPTPAITETPVPETTPAPTAVPETPSPSPAPTEEVPSDILIETAAAENTPAPLATANENTLVFALPTQPPVQTAFDELLSLNGDTVGFLEIEDVIALPVVQKPNDNEYYLTHNFENKESIEGALFLDGSNLLNPEDVCLIVYGHNMRNDTMFGRLEAYQDMTFLKKHALVRFDTLYQNRTYVPFAAFAASMDKNSSHYFDVRQFVFDETSFELFTLKMQTRSVWEVPVDVCWGDNILLLVTCDYTNTSGRFILALREMRSGETEDELRAAIQNVRAN